MQITPQTVERAAQRILRQEAALQHTVIPDRLVKSAAHSITELVFTLLRSQKKLLRSGETLVRSSPRTDRASQDQSTPRG